MFTDQENLEIQQGKYGTHDREQFDDWVNSEKYELELALGGQETMANFSFSMQRQNSEGGPTNADQDCANAAELYSALMKDFCVKSYRESYDKIGWLWAE